MVQRDYPYMYARVSAKRKKLLDKSDYENLLKMEPNEIARNLEEGAYKEDIDELGSDYEGIELVELALMRNLSRTMSKLVDIAPESLKPVIKTYLRRYDILSLKRLLRWKQGGGNQRIENLLVPVGDYSVEELEDLSEKTFEEIVESIEFKDSPIDYASYIGEEQDLRKIERNLDRAYYEDLDRVSGKIGGVWFGKFVKQEIEYENLKIALRLKKQGIERERIEEWLVSDKKSKHLEKVLESKSFDEAIDYLVEEEVLEKKNGGDLEDIEHRLEVARLDRALVSQHTEPLGATSILGYIMAKMIEVQNLRMLLRAKETGIQNLETIRNNLVVS